MRSIKMTYLWKLKHRTCHISIETTMPWEIMVLHLLIRMYTCRIWINLRKSSKRFRLCVKFMRWENIEYDVSMELIAESERNLTELSAGSIGLSWLLSSSSDNRRHGCDVKAKRSF